MSPAARVAVGLAVWAASRVGLALLLGAGAGAGDGVMGLTAGWVERMLAGESPYDTVGVAYPPLAMAVFVLPAALPVGYAAAFPLLVLAADGAGLAMAVAADRSGRPWAAAAYAAAVAAAGPVLVLWRYDLLPAVAHLAAAWLALRGRHGWSWLALGAGVALKPYLAVVVPLWLAWSLRGRGAASALRGCALAAVPSLLAGLAFLPLAGRDVALPYLFQLRRGLNVESVPAAVLAELGSSEAVFSNACLCWERAGAAAPLLGLAAAVAALAAAAALAGAVWRRPTAPVLVAASAAAVLALVLVSGVFSPQYVLWPLPVLALLADRRALAAAGAAALVAAAGYPRLFEAFLAHDWTARGLVWGRAALLAAACWSAWPSRSGSSGSPTSASPRCSTR